MNHQKHITRRDFLKITGIASIGAFVSACVPKVVGTQAPANTAIAAPTATAAPTVIVKPYAGKTLTIYQQASPIFETAYDQFKPYFEELTGATLKFVALPYTDMQTKLALALTTANSDLDVTWFNWIPSWMDQGLVEKMQPYVDNKNLTPADWDINDFIPAVWNSGIYDKDKQLYSLVCTANAMALYYRKDKLKAAGYDTAPSTWDEVLTYAQKLDNKNDKPLLFMLSPSGSQLGFTWLCLWFAHDYTYVWDDNGKCIVNNPDGLDSTKRIKDLLAFAPAGVLTWDFAEAHAAFQAGNGALFPQWNNLGGIYNDPKGSKAADLWDMAMPPKIKVNATDSGNWFSYVASNSKNKELAWIYLREFTSKQWQKKFFLNPQVNMNPGRQSIYSDPDALAFAPWMNGILQSNQAGRPQMAMQPEWPQIRDILHQNLGLYFSGDNNDLQGTMDTIAKKVDQVLVASGRQKS